MTGAEQIDITTIISSFEAIITCSSIKNIFTFFPIEFIVTFSTI